MNWTGGSLQRTKHANKGVLQKQKAYFARARTQLQNESNSPAAPFRPNYLREDDDFDLTGHLPLLGSGSIRHTGHSARRKGERTQQEGPQTDRRRVSGDDAQSGHDVTPAHLLHCVISRTAPAERASKEQHGEKKSVTDTDLETQLLEANRKRLLRQQDWVAVDPSKPVSLHFLSSKEKDRIGKRRKVRGTHRTTARHRNHADFLGLPPQSAGDAFTGALVSGAIRNDIDNIRIRVGTEAWTNTHSALPTDYVQSQASSDPMLFDQESRNAGSVRMSESPRPVRPQLHTAASASRQGNELPLTDDKARRSHDCTQQRKPHSPQYGSEQDIPEYDQIERRPKKKNSHIRQATGLPCEGSTPGYRITQCIQGIERPLRLVIGNPICSADAHSGVVSEDNAGEVQYAQDAHAGASQMRPERQIDSEYARSTISEASAALPIVDEEPWKTFLAISDGGVSHSTTAFEPDNALLHSEPTARNSEAVTNWSQHATRGDRTHISSSCISTSLPSLKQPVSARQSGARTDRRGNPVETNAWDLNENERLWQAFVFGSGSKSSSETHHRHEHDTERRMSKDFGEASARYLPSSLAVGSVSSAPFTAVPEPASCTSDNVQDTGAWRRSGFRAISSPVFHGFVEVLSNGEQGDGLAEQSVAHASLQNDASSETEITFSRFFSDTRACCSSLDRPDHTRDVSSAWVATSRREVERASPIYDTPVDESSEGLDLVDPNRST